MKKYAIFALALVLTVALLTACGCSNSKPAVTQPSTLPPTTGATLMPTTEATTMPTTMPTTVPTTEATTVPDTTDDTVSGDTQTETDGATDQTQSRSRMPAVNGK